MSELVRYPVEIRIGPSLVRPEDPAAFRILELIPIGFEPSEEADLAAGVWRGTVPAPEVQAVMQRRVEDIMERLGALEAS